MARVRWGLSGCGAVTEVKSGPAFQKIKGLEAMVVMRRDGGKIQDYARRQKTKWYGDANLLTKSSD